MPFINEFSVHTGGNTYQLSDSEKNIPYRTLIQTTPDGVPINVISRSSVYAAGEPSSLTPDELGELVDVLGGTLSGSAAKRSGELRGVEVVTHQPHPRLPEIQFSIKYLVFHKDHRYDRDEIVAIVGRDRLVPAEVHGKGEIPTIQITGVKDLELEPAVTGVNMYLSHAKLVDEAVRTLYKLITTSKI